MKSRASALYFTSLQNCTKDASLRTSSPDSPFFYIRLHTIYKGLFTLFPNLITKESYNWWVTRRVWGFRHQISKTKYLKISKAKYLKISQNVNRTYREASGEHCGTVQKWLRNSPSKRYQMIRICPTGELETSSSPILCQFFSSIRRQAPDAKYPDGMSAEKNSGCDTSGWNGGGAKFRM